MAGPRRRWPPGGGRRRRVRLAATARFDVRGTSCSRPVRLDDHGRVGVVAEAGPGRGDVVGHDGVEALGPQLGERPLPQVARPGRRLGRRSPPAPGPGAWPGRGRRGCRWSARGRSRATPSSLPSLRSAATLGRKSATAAAITTTSAEAARAITSASISAAVSTRTTSTPGGSGRSAAAVTSTTDAPRPAASTATASPCLPDERLPRKRTGSMGSRVPPAVTRTRRPARSPAGAGRRGGGRPFPEGGGHRLHDAVGVG